MHLCTGSAVQFAACAVVYLPIALVFETMRVEWEAEFVFALAWLTVVLSIGAISLLHLLIRRGAAARIASLFYLTPAVTAAFAWLLFGETLGARGDRRDGPGGRGRRHGHAGRDGGRRLDRRPVGPGRLPGRSRWRRSGSSPTAR